MGLVCPLEVEGTADPEDMEVDTALTKSPDDKFRFCLKVKQRTRFSMQCCSQEFFTAENVRKVLHSIPSNDHSASEE